MEKNYEYLLLIDKRRAGGKSFVENSDLYFGFEILSKITSYEETTPILAPQLPKVLVMFLEGCKGNRLRYIKVCSCPFPPQYDSVVTSTTSITLRIHEMFEYRLVNNGKKAAVWIHGWRRFGISSSRKREINGLEVERWL